MTIYVAIGDLLFLYEQIMAQSGGLAGLRDAAAFDSSCQLPRATYDGVELYTTLAAKAAALGYALIQNHPFIDGNKRIGHATVELFLLLNGYELAADIDEQERVILAVASGTMARQAFAA